MREMVNLSVRLLIIAALAGFVLSVTNIVTKEPIKRNEAERADNARKECMPAAESFSEIAVEGEGFSNINAIYEATAQGKTLGYVFELVAGGYKGGVGLTIGLDTVEGKPTITRVVAGANEETPGLGTKALDQNRLSGYIGQEAGLAFIDAVTGATITSDAVEASIKTVGNYYSQILRAKGEGN